MSINTFSAQLLSINTKKIVRIPNSESEQLPSRGMVMIEGTFNKVPFHSAMEPDGSGGHWFEVSDALEEEAKVAVGDLVVVTFTPMDQWLEPNVPEDLSRALEMANLQGKWSDITVKARWDWIRWIQFTRSEQTRQKRIKIMCSKLQDDDNRPCCFDRTRCTLVEVSKNGVLLEKEQLKANV